MKGKMNVTHQTSTQYLIPFTAALALSRPTISSHAAKSLAPNPRCCHSAPGSPPIGTGWPNTFSNLNYNRPLVLHWDGATWSAVGTPSPGLYADFQAVATISSTDIWAAGSYFGEDNYLHPLPEHSKGCASMGRGAT